MAIRKLLLCFFVRCMFSAPLRRMSSTGWTCSCPLNLSPRQIPGHFLTFARASLCSLKCPSKHVCASTPSVLIFPPRGTPVPRPPPAVRFRFTYPYRQTKIPHKGVFSFASIFMTSLEPTLSKISN